MRRPLPLIGVLASLALLAVATGRYPGGYDVLEQSISSLFQPIARDGQANGARWPASLAVIVFCTSMAFVFAGLARRGPTRFHRKTVQVAGIGAMVYAALVVTPMHDVLVGVALVFFLTAVVTLAHGLFLERRLGLLALGVTSLALVLGNATLYYGDLLSGFLPVVQKVSLGLWVTWLFALHFSDATPRADGERAGQATERGERARGRP